MQITPSYNTKQQVRHLSERIKLLQEKRHTEDNLFNLAWDNSSRVSDLLLRLIQSSELQYRIPTYADLENSYNNFPARNKFTLLELREKYWFRIVMNRVSIPTVVWSTSRRLNETDFSQISVIQELEELIKNSSDTFISDEDVQTYCSEHNTKSGSQLTVEQLKEFFLCKGIGQSKYSLGHNATYLLLQWNNKEALEFLCRFAEEYNLGGHNYFKVDKSKADKIVEAHRALYPDCPTTSQFIQDGLLIDKGNYYLITQTNNGRIFNLESSLHAIAAQLWILYQNDNRFSDDESRLNFWLDLVLTFPRYPSECFRYMDEETKNRFLELVEKKLIEDEDIRGNDSELDKLWLEENMGRRSDTLLYRIQFHFSDAQSHYDKYQLMQELASRQHNLFYADDCRNRLDLLLHILMNCGQTSEEPTFAYPIVIRLLNLSTTKPYLLWQICIGLEHRHPEIIPYLLLEPGFREIGFQLLQKININLFALNFPDEGNRFHQSSKFKIELLKEYFEALLACLLDANDHDSQGAILLRVIKEYSRNLFLKSGNFSENQLIEQKDKFLGYNTLWEILASARSNTRNMGSDVIERSPIFYFIARGFLKELLSEKPKEDWNEIYYPEVNRIDIGIRLLKTIRNPILFNRPTLREPISKELDGIDSDTLQFIHKTYKSFFEKRKILVRTNSTTEVEERDLRFQSSSYAIDRIDWSLYLQSLDFYGQKEFFAHSVPHFDLSTYQDVKNADLDDVITNEAHRLRFHIRVMLCSYNSLIDQRMSNQGLLNALETELTFLFQSYSQTIISKNQYDVFNRNLEYYSGINLISDFLEAANCFSEENRRMIIDKILENELSLNRVLLSLNIFSAEGDQSYLRNKLSEAKMEAFLEGQYYLPEIENVLINSINNPYLVNYAEQILTFIERKTNIPVQWKSQHEIILFEVKLIIAYRKDDMDTLESIEVPRDNEYGISDKSIELNARKSYFRASLLWKRQQFDEADKILQRLSISANASFRVLNARFSLQLEIAKNKYKDDFYKLKLDVKNALDVMLAAEASRDYEIEDFYKEEILLTKLEAYDLLEWNEEFDILYAQVRGVNRYLQRFAEMFLQNKIRRKQVIEAEAFIRQLEKYHANRAGEIPEFIAKFKAELSVSQKSIPYISSAYTLLLALTEQDRIKALPDTITKYKSNYGEFLLYEIVRACSGFQRKQYALLKSGDVLDVLEDKITDMIELIANSRLSAWNIKLSSQNRSGTTGKDTNELARVDLSSPVGLTMIVVESVRMYSYKSLKSQKGNLEYHILKAFNETPNRKYFYHLVYYQADKFGEDWGEFLNQLLPFVSYPPQMAITGSPEEMSDLSMTDLKVGKTCHDQDVTCYYIFVNLNYPLSIVQKVISRVKKGLTP